MIVRRKIQIELCFLNNARNNDESGKVYKVKLKRYIKVLFIDKKGSKTTKDQ